MSTEELELEQYYREEWNNALNDDGTVTANTGQTLTYSATGEPKWLCDGCPVMFVYVEHPLELDHICGG